MSESVERAAEVMRSLIVNGHEFTVAEFKPDARAVLTAALSDREPAARAMAARWWDRNADDTDLWDDLTAAEQENVIENIGAREHFNALAAHILGGTHE